MKVFFIYGSALQEIYGLFTGYYCGYAILYFLFIYNKSDIQIL